ncbi:hypothetical protein [Chryseobacterium aureum]|uniref:hypothetical protein n=1 Tax=Chryseobacterium aureum TaxID=2497456 RepID=UPI000F89D08E|nr:hypothetical protein [Chryseobacterium aureum]
MMSKILIWVFSIFFLCSYGQKKKEKHVDLLADYHSFKEGDLKKGFKPAPLTIRISTFPFNKATKVQIISYNLNLKRSTANSYMPPPPPPKTRADSCKITKYYDSIKKNAKFELREAVESSTFERIQESKTLTLPEISELSDVLYNTCDKYYIRSVSSSGCFFPRNAILFYDEGDKIFAYFEICFECSAIESSPRNILDPFKTCEYIYPDLQKFFKSKGLTTEYVEKK